MTEHQQGTASKSPHVHKWIDKALLHEPPLKVCACGATMTDNEYRDSPNRDDRDRASDAAFRRRLNRWLPGLPWKGWANEWPLGRHWRLNVEWVPAGRSFSFWIYDRRNDD